VYWLIVQVFWFSWWALLRWRSSGFRAVWDIFCTLLLIFWDCLLTPCRLLSTSYRCSEEIEVAVTVRSVSTLFYRSIRRIHPTVPEPASYKTKLPNYEDLLYHFGAVLFFYIRIIRVLKSTRRVLWSRFQYVVDGVTVFAIKRVSLVWLLYLNCHWM